jgi:hypothetical protein
LGHLSADLIEWLSPYKGFPSRYLQNNLRCLFRLDTVLLYALKKAKAVLVSNL